MVVVVLVRVAFVSLLTSTGGALICGNTGDVHANAVPAATAPRQTVGNLRK